MISDTVFDPDYPTKQSAGYMFVRLLFVQAVFIVFYVMLALVGNEASAVPHLPALRISEEDVILILIGIIANFALFLVVFAVWQSIEYRLSSEHLVIRKGLLVFNTESVISFSSIDRGTVRQSFLGRIFNYGTVEIILNVPTGRRPLRLYGIPYPYQFLSYLKAQLLTKRHYKK